MVGRKDKEEAARSLINRIRDNTNNLSKDVKDPALGEILSRIEKGFDAMLELNTLIARDAEILSLEVGALAEQDQRMSQGIASTVSGKARDFFNGISNGFGKIKSAVGNTRTHFTGIKNRIWKSR